MEPSLSGDRPECPIVLDRLPALIAGDVPAAEALLIAAHLGACAGCHAEHDAFMEVARAIDDPLPMEQARADRALAHALDAASSGSHWRNRWVAAAAAAALLASLGLLGARSPGISLAELGVASRAVARGIKLPKPRVDAMTLSSPTGRATTTSAPGSRRSE